MNISVLHYEILYFTLDDSHVVIDAEQTPRLLVTEVSSNGVFPSLSLCSLRSADIFGSAREKNSNEL